LRRLYLLRHAKAVSAASSSDDEARALAPRGRADAIRLGAWLSERDMRPDLTLCSPAKRTVETWQGVSRAFAAPPETQIVGALYLAPASVVLAQLRKARPDVKSLMAVGHNPGLEMLALHLARKARDVRGTERARAMAEGRPTCALAVFDFDIEDWKQLDTAGGELVAFVRPKDLGD
jgi:phosphohistidine phosphatase